MAARLRRRPSRGARRPVVCRGWGFGIRPSAAAPGGPPLFGTRARAGPGEEPFHSRRLPPLLPPLAGGVPSPGGAAPGGPRPPRQVRRWPPNPNSRGRPPQTHLKAAALEQRRGVPPPDRGRLSQRPGVVRARPPQAAARRQQRRAPQPVARALQAPRRRGGGGGGGGGGGAGTLPCPRGAPAPAPAPAPRIPRRRHRRPSPPALSAPSLQGPLRTSPCNFASSSRQGKRKRKRKRKGKEVERKGNV